MTARSMTGFGEARALHGNVEIAVEIKSVNHRFLDVITRLPPIYSRLETEVAKTVRSGLHRGRVEVFVNRKEVGEPEFDIRFNRNLFRKYLSTVREALSTASIHHEEAVQTIVLQLISRREVLELVPREQNAEGEYGSIREAVSAALRQLIEMRAAEGAELVGEVVNLLSQFEQILSRIATQVETTPEEYREKLAQRIERLSPDVPLDPERLAQEIAIFADKVDVTEEIARLQSHILQFRASLDQDEVGRKLEFLLQEFGREINTIGSKAQNSVVTALVVEAKGLMEKLREQAANLE